MLHEHKWFHSNFQIGLKFTETSRQRLILVGRCSLLGEYQGVIIPYIFVFQYILLKATYKISEDIPCKYPFFVYNNIPIQGALKELDNCFN